MILDIFDKVKEVGSTKVKEQIIRDNASNETLKRVFKLAYSKRIMFGIKKWPGAGEFSQSKGLLTLEDALDFLENKLATRELTGNAAIAELMCCIADLNPKDAEVVRRIIARDLDIGASKSIANKVWSGLIPTQPQMLATPYSDKAVAKIKFPAYAQLKADGARCFAEIRGDKLEDVQLLTRSGNEYLCLDKLKQQLIDATREARILNPDGVLIDGELVYFPIKPMVPGDLAALFDTPDEDTDEVVSSREAGNGIMNKSLEGSISSIEAEGVKYQVWDFLPLTAYTGVKTDEYDKRFADLTKVVEGFDRVILIENNIVNSLDEAKVVYKKYVDMKLEGIILKNTFGLWEDTRSKNQVKFKEVISFDLEVFDTYVHKKDPTKLGGVWLRSKCGRIRTKCGSGFSDTTHTRHKDTKTKKTIKTLIPLSERDSMDREYLWSIRDELNGLILEGECNSWTKSKGRKEPFVSLFLPIALKFRNDKDVANTFEEVFGTDFTETTGIK